MSRVLITTDYPRPGDEVDEYLRGAEPKNWSRPSKAGPDSW
ncbi:hypothetical protein [Amycolatopsis sp. NPDC051061]